MVCLLPHFGVAGKEVDEVGGRNPQRLGRLADTGLNSAQDIKDDTDRRPEARVLDTESQPAVGAASIAVIVVTDELLRSQLLGGEFVAQLEVEGSPQAPESAFAVL